MSNSTQNNRESETPLESWKEIAAYLQRDVSTAIRWEKKEGLPVHRHHHLARSSVYAYPGELDAWRANREPSPEQPAPLWRRPLPSTAFALAILLGLMTVGSGPYIPGTVQAADRIITQQVWLEAHGAIDGAPSPDGKYMSYTDWDSGNLAIRDLEAETSRLVTNDGTWEQPAQFTEASKWSPDGKHLAYSWNAGRSAYELRILAVDAPKPRVLIREEGDGAWVEPQDWSPDGRHILARFSTGPVSRQLALIPVEGGSPRVVKTFDSGSISSGVARFSPDGSYIVYDRSPGKVAALDLFVLDVSSGRETTLVQHPADDCVFGWSPDGKWVLFLSDRAGTLDYWAVRVADGKPAGTPIRVKRSVGRVAPLGFARDGSFFYADVKVARDVYSARIDFEHGKVVAPAEKAVVRFEGSNMNPRYSPDGKSLAYISRRGSMVFPTARGNALCIQSLDSGGERVFMDEFARLGVRAVAGPRWSPDSRSIVVAGLWVAGARSGLYLVSLDTGDVKPVVELPAGVRVSGHEWSHQGQHLFYLKEDTNQKLSLLVELDLRTGEEREVNRWPEDEGPAGIAASPDGEWLAIFTRNQRRLSVIPSGGGTVREVHSFEQGYYTNPEWAPDGKHILIGEIKPPGATGTLYRVPVEGGQPQEIVLQKRFWDRLSVHPDGQQIAFATSVNYDTDVDIWVMQNFLPGSAARSRPDEAN